MPAAAQTASSQAPLLRTPDAALTLVDGLDLDGYHLFHAIRANLLRRLGRTTDAALAYKAAIARTENKTERDFLRRSHHAVS
jgi:RNA polymerase sigma-70 factor, ECF subfamily